MNKSHKYYRFGKLIIRVSHAAEFEFQDIKTGKWLTTDEKELNALDLLKEIKKHEQN